MIAHTQYMYFSNQPYISLNYVGTVKTSPKFWIGKTINYVSFIAHVQKFMSFISKNCPYTLVLVIYTT